MSKSDDQQRESRRILAHMQQQTDGAAMGVVQRAARRGKDHFSAADTDENDRIEIWGTRIGRALSLILFFGLIAYIALVLTGRL